MIHLLLVHWVLNARILDPWFNFTKIANLTIHIYELKMYFGFKNLFTQNVRRYDKLSLSITSLDILMVQYGFNKILVDMAKLISANIMENPLIFYISKLIKHIVL